MCIKHINNLAINNKSTESTMDTKFDNLFEFDDQLCSNGLSSSQRESQLQPSIHNEPNGSYCKYCLTKLNSFQLDFDQAITLCSNKECPRYKSNDLSLYEIQLSSQSYKQDKLVSGDSDADLNFIFSSFVDLAKKVIATDLKPYEQNAKENQSYEMFESNIDLQGLSGDNTNVEPYNNQLVDGNSQNNAQLNINSSFLNVNKNSNDHLQQQQSINMFDDNFFKDIDNLLLGDLSYSENVNCNNEMNINNQNEDINFDWIEMQTDGISNVETVAMPNNSLFEYDQPLIDSKAPYLTPMKPTNEAKIKEKLASELECEEFFGKRKGERENQFEIVTTGNDEIISNVKSKNSVSGIVIVKKKPANDSVTSSLDKNTEKLEVSIASTKLKIIGEKEEIMNLVKKTTNHSSNSSAKTSKLQPLQPTAKLLNENSQKSQMINSNKLLPWEIKSKDYKKKLTSELDSAFKPNTTSASSTTVAKLNGISTMSRIQNSVTKADLSQKTKDSKLNLKEKGASLKHALLHDASFLSNFSSTTAKPTSGIKDLVLSVLKKNVPTPTS